MKHCVRVAMVFLLWSVSAFAVYNVGDTVADKCWQDDAGKSVCLSQNPKSVRVLLFNAGWCGPCNEEFSELVPRVTQYAGKPVVFISLSGSGYSQSQPADGAFLRSWRARFNIPFAVAASPHDAGRDFFHPPYYIPSVAVVGQNGKLAYAAVNPGVDALFDEIDRALIGSERIFLQRGLAHDQ